MRGPGVRIHGLVRGPLGPIEARARGRWQTAAGRSFTREALPCRAAAATATGFCEMQVAVREWKAECPRYGRSAQDQPPPSRINWAPMLRPD